METLPSSLGSHLFIECSSNASSDMNKDTLVEYNHGAVFQRLIDLASNSEDSEVQYNCAGTIGQLALRDIPMELLEASVDDLLNYLNTYNFVHISLWTIVQLLKYEFRNHVAMVRMKELSLASATAAIRELTRTIINAVVS